MAATPAVRRARRSLVFLLIIFIALAGVITFGVFARGATWVPKLALDLQGGTQILLAAEQTDGKAVNGEQLDQAVAIIRQRVDAAGVSEAEITTQGSNHISVSIPGKADKETLRRIEASAKLDFRPVLQTGYGVSESQMRELEKKQAEAEKKSSDSAKKDTEGDAAAADSSAEQTPSVLTDEQLAQLQKQEQKALAASDSELYPKETPKSAGDQAWLTDALLAKFNAFSCQSELAQEVSNSDATKPLITCDESGATKYILGPVEVKGDVIKDAAAGQRTTQTGAVTGEWEVQITMNSKGAKQFGKVSSRLYGKQQPFNQFAFVLDGRVLSAPTMNAVILDGRPSISGNFTQESAKTLADQLKFGALPMDFKVQSQEDISATLGSNQLQAGLLAGLIGLLLVVVYSMFQYRALGTLTIASLAIAAALTYLLLCFFSWRQGYRLSLAGVAGIIVAIGFTADSFIVYFERIRDALRDGFPLEQAVEHGWKKALRTVLASDGVNFLAAGILFVLAVGSVKGFAFTLGLTTLVDVVVVALFTHPMMALLARTKFFGGGHPASGLDPRALGALYRGRLQFAAPAESKKQERKHRGAKREAERRLTIAERKAAESGKES